MMMKTKTKQKTDKAYEVDASMIRGNCKEVVHPRSIAEVRRIVSETSRIAIRGAGTGFSGGAVPLNGEDVLMDLSKLNRIGSFDFERRTLEVEAGAVLEDIQNYLEEYSLEFPIDILSGDVATIGGMIATNAVGKRAVKYGRTSEWVKWVEVVDCFGNIERKGTTEISDYAGLEGITGVIVRACLKLSQKVRRTASLVGLASLSEVIGVVKNLKRDSNVSMIYFLDKWISNELEIGHQHHLLVEYEGDEGLISGEEYFKLIRLLEKVYGIVANEGHIIIQDPKIIVDKILPLMEWLEFMKIPTFGPIGVGIVHPCFKEKQRELIPEMINRVKRLSGQVSGAFGIGLMKRDYVEINDQKILRNIKKRTDALNKFNVGKII